MERHSKYPYKLKRTCEWCETEFIQKIECYETLRCKPFCKDEHRRKAKARSMSIAKTGKNRVVSSAYQKKPKRVKKVRILQPYQLKNQEYYQQLRRSYGLEERL